MSCPFVMLIQLYPPGCFLANSVRSYALFSMIHRGSCRPHRAVSRADISFSHISVLPLIPRACRGRLVSGISSSEAFSMLKWTGKYYWQHVSYYNNLNQVMIRGWHGVLLGLLWVFCSHSQTSSMPELPEYEDKQFESFAENLGNFLPSESFEFELAPAEQQTFIYWPSPDIKILRGMFYITSDDNNGLFVGIEHADKLEKTYWDKKMGVFSVNYTGTGDMKIITKSQVKNLKVYLSYQLTSEKSLKPRPAQTEEKEESELGKVLERFKSVRNTLSGQEQILKSIVKSTAMEAERLTEELNSKTFRAAAETVVLVASGLVSLWMLRRQFKKGYELIV